MSNIVAAEILMDSDEVLRYIYEYGYTAEQIASAMSTDINLVALKVAHLATLGYNLHALEHVKQLFEITYLRGALTGSSFFANCADAVCTIISLTSACDRASLFPRTAVPDQCQLLPTSHHTVHRHLYIRR